MRTIYRTGFPIVRQNESDTFAAAAGVCLKWALERSDVNPEHRSLSKDPFRVISRTSIGGGHAIETRILQPNGNRSWAMRFTHPHRDEQGIDEWSLRVSQNGRQLLADDGGGTPREVTWSLGKSDSKLQRDGSVIATYRVRDAAGSSVTASDTVAVDYVTLQTMKARQEEGKMVERYSLIVFDFNSAKLNPSNQRIMQRVKDRIQSTSKVRIMGFADRQGNAEYNRELARKRCVEAQRALGLSDDRVVIEPVGSDRLLYDNDTPEGRSYSRTVQIEVVTPVR